MGLLDFFKRGKVEGQDEIIQEQVVEERVITNPNVQLSSSDSEAVKFQVEDVFTITGRGTVVTGTVLSGTVHLNDSLQLPNGMVVQVTGIEMFRKTLEYAQVGDKAGLLLSDITRDEVQRGMVLTK